MSDPVKRRIPSGQEFSPGQVQLAAVLAITLKLAGNRDAILTSLQAEYPKFNRRRAENVLLGLHDYGLYDRDAVALTGLGKTLLDEPDDANRYASFAKHMLSAGLPGMEVVQVVLDLQSRGEKPGKATIGAELRRRGFSLPADSTNHLILLNWLREADVVAGKNYEIDLARVKTLTGVDLADADEWASLTPDQRSFLRALQQKGQVHGTAPVWAKEIRKSAETNFGSEFSGSMRAKVITPLEDGGWLTTDGWSSGGKSGKVAATQKLLDLDIDVATRLSAGLIPPELRKKLNTPLGDIFAGLKAKDTHTRGISLELLALRVAYDIGLAPMGFRVRSAETGQAEVDLVAEGAHLLFSRWLFQCKNTAQVSLPDLAKEIGMAMLLHAHVVVIVTTGRCSQNVRDHAKKAAENTPLQIVLVEGPLLAKYQLGGGSLVEHFQDQAANTLMLKRSQVGGIV